MSLVDSPGAAQQAAARAHYERDELLASSRALSSERDIHKLLDLILLKSRQITGADAGSVYILETEDSPPSGESVPGARRAARRTSIALGEAMRGTSLLHFMLSQNDSMPVDFQESRLKVDASSIAGKAALAGRTINIPDFAALGSPAAGLTHNRSFDLQSGYQTRSMLTVPMLSAMGDVIGVIQLINKKRLPDRKLLNPDDFATQVVPFDAQAEQMALALASQAGVSLENAMLYDEIRRLFESFVDASVTAIEARDPTTSGHSRRVARLAVALAEQVDALTDGPLGRVHFSRDELRQLGYAGILHDFGKVGVREQVLVKAKKLYDWQLGAVEMRFRYLRQRLAAEALRGQIGHLRLGGGEAEAAVAVLERDLAARLCAVDELWRLVVTANEPTVMDGPTQTRLAELAVLTYLDEEGRAQPYLTPDELSALQVARGSLTPDERVQIQSHVEHTIAFLATIPWGRALRAIPHIAGAHHELLDGSGYPRKLRGDAIPIEARMLTIADIFDALTAADRPYKAAVPVPRALAILESDVRAGRCDGDLFRVFVDAEIWKRVM